MLLSTYAVGIFLLLKQGSTIVTDDVQHQKEMIAKQNRLADEAPSPEVAEIHLQLMSLYEAQLAMCERRNVESDHRLHS